MEQCGAPSWWHSSHLTTVPEKYKNCHHTMPAWSLLSHTTCSLLDSNQSVYNQLQIQKPYYTWSSENADNGNKHPPPKGAYLKIVHQPILTWFMLTSREVIAQPAGCRSVAIHPRNDGVIYASSGVSDHTCRWGNNVCLSLLFFSLLLFSARDRTQGLVLVKQTLANAVALSSIPDPHIISSSWQPLSVSCSLRVWF